MAPSMGQLVRLYNRGVFTTHELASRLIEATTERPTAQLVTSLPPDAVDIIREQASAPPTTKWVQIASCCTGDLEAWEAGRREQMARWLAGFALWREYFGFNAEERT